MKDYRCYMLDGRGHIAEVLEFRSADDGAALNLSRNHFEHQRFFPGFEIWNLARLVHQHAP
jgi:hypothetical protein